MWRRATAACLIVLRKQSFILLGRLAAHQFENHQCGSPEQSFDSASTLPRLITTKNVVPRSGSLSVAQDFGVNLAAIRQAHDTKEE